MTTRQKITTFLWFDRNAEEAVRFYLSIFKNSRLLGQSYWGEGGHVPKGTLLTATLELEGQQFIALNGGPQFHFTEAISLLVNCDTQAEVDELWDKLCSGGGAPSQCGWLKDRFGLSWQIVPRVLFDMLHDRDQERVQRVVAAMLPMQKLDIRRLRAAYEQS